MEDSEEDERQSALNLFTIRIQTSIIYSIGRIALLESKKAEIEAEIETLRNPPPKEKKEKEKKEKRP